MSVYGSCKEKKIDVLCETGYHFVIAYLSETELK